MHTAVEAGIHVQALASAIVGCVLDGVEGRQMYGVVGLGLELGAETLTSRHIVHCVYPRRAHSGSECVLRELDGEMMLRSGVRARVHQTK